MFSIRNRRLHRRSVILLLLLSVPEAQTTCNCRLAEVDNGEIINLKTSQPFTYTDACVERGPSIGYNEKASTDAHEAVRQFMAELLKQQ